MKWNYICEEKVLFPDRNDARNGWYLVYLKTTYDTIIADKKWKEFEEREYILEHNDNRLESNNGELIFIPDVELAFTLECNELKLSQEEA